VPIRIRGFRRTVLAQERGWTPGHSFLILLLKARKTRDAVLVGEVFCGVNAARKLSTAFERNWEREPRFIGPWFHLLCFHLFSSLSGSRDNSRSHQTRSTAGSRCMAFLATERGSIRSTVKPMLVVQNGRVPGSGSSMQSTATFRFWPSGGSATRRRRAECGPTVIHRPRLAKETGGWVEPPRVRSLNSQIGI